MHKFIISGGEPLHGEVTLQGAKNVAIKMFVGALLTNEELVLHNVPDIGDVRMMLEVMRGLGVQVKQLGKTVSLCAKDASGTRVPLEVGARLRTSSMVIGPLLHKHGKATIPNPGGCRLGARPIDRHIEAIRHFGVDIAYDSDDGYFHASTISLQGANIHFNKNTHTGTETVILAAVGANGKTIIEGAAREVEIDDLIKLLQKMGAVITREGDRIDIEGGHALHGCEYTVMPDRNEEVTFAIAACLTNGSITVRDSRREHIVAFLEVFEKVGGGVEEIDRTTTRYYKKSETLQPSEITTLPHPGFMTDWQAPWAVLMTQAIGKSTIHETVFESRFSYIHELNKMGAQIDFFEPTITDPEVYYNFHWHDRVPDSMQGIAIVGPTPLHNGIVTINDIRAGATVILAALAAKGISVVYDAEKVDRGYEAIEQKLAGLGATIRREVEGHV